MTTRDRILAETLARLEAERFAGPRRPVLTPPAPKLPEPVTPEQAAENARLLLDALSDDPTVVEFTDRHTHGGAA